MAAITDHISPLTYRLEDITVPELAEKIRSGQVCYVGLTINPPRRGAQHKRAGYRGIMYVARTEHMKRAETEVLHSCQESRADIPYHEVEGICKGPCCQDHCCEYNRQFRSNASLDQPGYVYGIEGMMVQRQ